MRRMSESPIGEYSVPGGYLPGLTWVQAGLPLAQIPSVRIARQKADRGGGTVWAHWDRDITQPNPTDFERRISGFLRDLNLVPREPNPDASVRNQVMNLTAPVPFGGPRDSSDPDDPVSCLFDCSAFDIRWSFPSIPNGGIPVKKVVEDN